MRSEIHLSDCRVLHWGKDDEGLDHFVLKNDQLMGSISMGQYWWKSLVEELEEGFDLDFEKGKGKLYYKLFLGLGRQDIIFMGAKCEREGEVRVFLQVKRVYYGMKGDVMDHKVDVYFTREDCEKLGNFIRGWEAESEEVKRNKASVNESVIYLSDCMVKKSEERFDRFVLSNNQLLGPIRISTAFWIWILDNLERCWQEIGQVKEGERVCYDMWFGKGNQHFISQVIKFEETLHRVYLRIQRVHYRDDGLIKQSIADVFFSRDDIVRLRCFLERNTEGPDMALLAKWEREFFLG